jgi:hypothetical protein
MASPMPPERFQDRYEAFRSEPQQVSGVLSLHAAIKALPGSEAVLDEQAPWALIFSEKPAAPPVPAAPAGGLDPRGSEEAGMAGPQKAAPVQPGETYLLVNDRDEDLEAYDHSGQFLWKIPCLARGQGSDTDWSQYRHPTRSLQARAALRRLRAEPQFTLLRYRHGLRLVLV